jgi:hypothetical protein
MQRQQSKQRQHHTNVIPFTGELYPASPPAQTPAGDNVASMLVFIAAALVAGLSLGAIAVYQSADQTQLRQLKAESEQLQQVRSNVCR